MYKSNKQVFITNKRLKILYEANLVINKKDHYLTYQWPQGRKHKKFNFFTKRARKRLNLQD